MEILVDIGLRNAALAVPLAVLALILGLAVKRPALLHLLWVFVLLRLLMPPLWNVQVPWRPAFVDAAEVVAQAPAAIVEEPPANATPSDELPPRVASGEVA